jgi:hypothetical protein
MDRMQRLLLELLRSGLSGQAPSTADFPLTESEWKQLFFESHKQTIQGVVYDGIMLLPTDLYPPTNLLSQWGYAVQKIEGEFLKHLKLISYLSIRYQMEAGLSPVILKGLGLAALYPKPNHRVVGDIDMFFGGREASQKIDQLVTRWGAKVDGDEDEDNIETTFVFNDVVIENHKELIESFNLFYRRKGRRELEKKILDGSLFGQAIVEKTPIKVLIPLYNHLLLLTHSLKHVLNAGIGIRQLCDVAMLLKAEKQNTDGEALRKLLKDWGIYKWACLVYAFCVEYLGTVVEDLPFEFDVASYHPHILLQEVWKSGNFGQMDERLTKRAPEGDSVFTAKRIFGNAWRFLPYAPGDALGLPLEYTFGYIKKKLSPLRGEYGKAGRRENNPSGGSTAKPGGGK